MTEEDYRIEQYHISEILWSMEDNGEKETNPKLYKQYLKKWNELQDKIEYCEWVNSQPV